MKNFPFATNQFGNHAIECIVFLLQKGKQNGESVSTFPVPLDTFQALVFLAVHEESPPADCIRDARVIQLGVFSLVHFVEDVPLIRVGEVRDVLA